MHRSRGEIDAAEAVQRLRQRLGRALVREEALFDRRGRPKAGPWLEICAGVPAWCVLTQLPDVLAAVVADSATAPLLAQRGMDGMDDALARGVAAAKVASLLVAFERERRGTQGDLVTQLGDEVASLRGENERLRRAVAALTALAFAEAEAREGVVATRALPPPDPQAVMEMLMAPANTGEALAAARPASADA